MKKYMIILAALFTMAAVSCQKTETSAENEESIHFDFNIASFEPGTKAAKTDWSNGDKLNVWFDGNGSNQTIPDLVLTYNGSQWVAGALRSGVQANLKANGKVTLVYEGYNDLSRYTYEWYNHSEWFWPEYTLYTPTTGDIKVSAHPLVTYAEKKAYSYTSNTLTANIDSWKFRTCFKVLVLNDNSGMTLDAKSYRLQVKDADNNYPTSNRAWIISPDTAKGETEVAFNNGSGGFALGVPEEDGVAFYYQTFSTTEKDVTFELYYYDNTTPISKSYTATNKTINATDVSKCIGVVLKYSLFHE